MAWLTYEIIAFYLNIISIAVFLVLAVFLKYRTFKERLGFAGSLRKYQDFLIYC
jgi:transposase-like protein